MKKIFFTTFCVFLFHPTLANTLTLVAYDPTYYVIIEDLNTTVGRAGTLTAVSDIYYYYEPFSEHFTLRRAEWLSDGYGGEVLADYDSTFHYTGITFNNMHDILSGLIRDVDIENLRNQFIEYQLTYSQPQIKIIHSLRYILLQQDTNIMNLTINRLHNRDSENKNAFGIWGQTLYNYSKYTGETGFSSDAFGIALGVDNKITDSFVFGIGYNNYSTNISNFDTDSNLMFVYAKYNINKLFIDAITGYNIGNYYLDNESIGKTSSYFGNLTLGYNENGFNLLPSVGVRYIHNTITPSNKYFNKSETNFIMLVSSFTYDYKLGKSYLNAHFTLTYNLIKSDNDIMIVNYPVITDENLAPFGLETGVSLYLPINSIDISINYDINARSNYISHTGSLRLAYKF